MKQLIVDMGFIRECEKAFIGKIFVLNPYYASEGFADIYDIILRKQFGNIPVFVLDRNLFGKILSAVKSGSFKGNQRREMTGFLLWSTICNVDILPFFAINEETTRSGNAVSAAREMKLFDFFFKDISVDDIYNSFVSEGYCFKSLRFKEATLELGMDSFIVRDVYFYYHFASVLHLAYVLRKYNKPKARIINFVTWYFSNALISIYGLTYAILCFCKEVRPPHHFTDNSRIIDGCMNEAMDLTYLQRLNKTKDTLQYDLYLITEDKDIARVMKVAMEAEATRSIEGIVDTLLSFYNGKDRDDVKKYMIELITNHEKIDVTSQDSIVIGKNLCRKEEENLLEYIS